MPDSFATPWTVTHQAPLSMAFPGKNTELGFAIFFSKADTQARGWT